MINNLYQSDVETVQYFLRDMIDLERAVEAARRAVEDANKDAELACEIAEATSDDDPVELLEAVDNAAEAKDTIAEWLSDVVDALETSIESVENAQGCLQLILKIIRETKSNENIYL